MWTWNLAEERVLHRLEGASSTLSVAKIVACDVVGEPLPILSSTKDSIETITPATAEDILEHAAVALYEAQVLRLDPSLEAGLRMGEIFRTRFRPRAKDPFLGPIWEKDMTDRICRICCP